MSAIKMDRRNHYNRRRFLGITAMSIAAAEFVRIGSDEKSILSENGVSFEQPDPFNFRQCLLHLVFQAGS